MPENEVYQYSIMSALMAGLASASSSVPLSAILKHGDFGVGTFELMDGEMVVIDGQAYQFRGDGSAHTATADQLVPFAMVSHFVPQHSVCVKMESKEGVNDEIKKLAKDATNAFVLFKITGVWDMVRIRTTYKQSYPRQPLIELTNNQIVKEFHGVKGTMVGLRSPQWSSGVSVAGMHAHFIDESRKIGGHVLEMSSSEELILEVAVSNALKLELPNSSEFGERDLELDEAGIQKAES